MKNKTHSLIERQSGFTLIEVLVSTVMCAIILAAVHSLLYNVLNLREKAEKNIQIKQSVHHVMATIKKDLLNIISSDSESLGPLYGENSGNTNQQRDFIEFYTTTGSIRENVPWGDVQKIYYSIMVGRNMDNQNETFLVRSVTRNLFSSIEEEPEHTILLKDVYSLDISYYDGYSWIESWDTEVQEEPLPVAIRFRIEYTPIDKQENQEISPEDISFTYPYELIVPICTTPYEEAEEEEQAAEGAQEENENPNPEGNENPGGNMGGGNQNPGGERG